MIPCPRCERENPPEAPRCAGCGLPLVLRDEPAPRSLDVDLDLDRRRRDPPPTSATPEAVPEPTEPPDLPLQSEPPSDPAASGEPLPAAPARRVLAWAIDGALVAGAAVGVPTLAGAFGGAPGSRLAVGSPEGRVLLLLEAFVVVVTFVYATASHALGGATLGKRIAGIRVIGHDGRPPAPAVSALRSCWAVLSVAAAGIGLLPALLTPSRRALHDLLAGTRVVQEP